MGTTRAVRSTEFPKPSSASAAALPEVVGWPGPGAGLEDTGPIRARSPYPDVSSGDPAELGFADGAAEGTERLLGLVLRARLEAMLAELEALTAVPGTPAEERRWRQWLVEDLTQTAELAVSVVGIRIEPTSVGNRCGGVSGGEISDRILGRYQELERLFEEVLGRMPADAPSRPELARSLELSRIRLAELRRSGSGMLRGTGPVRTYLPGELLG